MCQNASALALWVIQMALATDVDMRLVFETREGVGVIHERSTICQIERVDAELLLYITDNIYSKQIVHMLSQVAQCGTVDGSACSNNSTIASTKCYHDNPMTISNGPDAETSFINSQTTFTLKPLMGTHSCVITSGQPSKLPNGQLSESKCHGGTCTFDLKAGRKESSDVTQAFKEYVNSIGGESAGVVSGCGYNHINPPHIPNEMNFAFCGTFDNKLGETYDACFAQASLEPAPAPRSNHWIMASKDLQISCRNDYELTISYKSVKPSCHQGQTLVSKNNLMKFKVHVPLVPDQDFKFSACAKVDKCPSKAGDPLQISELKVNVWSTNDVDANTQAVVFDAAWQNCIVDNQKHTLMCPSSGDDVSQVPNQLSLKNALSLPASNIPAGAALILDRAHIRPDSGRIELTNVRPNAAALSVAPVPVSVDQAGNPTLEYETSSLSCPFHM